MLSLRKGAAKCFDKMGFTKSNCAHCTWNAVYQLVSDVRETAAWWTASVTDQHHPSWLGAS